MNGDTELCFFITENDNLGRMGSYPFCPLWHFSEKKAKLIASLSDSLHAIPKVAS